MAEVPGATVACPGCGKRYVWKAELAGRKVHCKCGQLMRLPTEPGQPAQAMERRPPDSAAGAKPASKPSAPPPKSSKISFASDSLAADDGSTDSTGKGKLGDGSNFNLKPTKRHKSEAGGYDLADSEEEESAPAAPASSGGGGEGRCGSCGSPVKPGAVICVNCGFHLKSGKKVKTEVSKGEGPATTAAPAAPARPLGGMMATMGAKSPVAAAVAQGDEDAEKSAKFTEVILPLILAVVGVALIFLYFLFLNTSEDVAIDLTSGAVAAVLQLVFRLPFFLLAIVLTARIMDTSFGPFFTAILKLAAISFFTSGLGLIIDHYIDSFTGGMGSMLVTPGFHFLIFWGLCAKLFDLDIMETVIVWILSNLIPMFIMAFLIGWALSFFMG